MSLTDLPQIRIGDEEYRCVRGSDIDRDGMYLELSLASDVAQSAIAEIFYSDTTATMTMTLFREDMPLIAIEWLIEQAKLVLPPSKGK